MAGRNPHNVSGKTLRKSRSQRRVVREANRRNELVAVSSTPPATSPDDPKGDGPVMEALGTTDREFAEGFVRQLVRAAGKYDIDDLLFRLAVMRGAKPRDPLESMLLAQMGAVHDAIIRIAGQLAGAETLHHQDCAARAINQLARTYASQLEELKRWRSGDDAKVTVQNLSVSHGAQAIVGNVNNSTPGSLAKETETPALTDARQPLLEPLGEPEKLLVTLRRTPKEG
jgi:hypothetical protein